MIVFSIPNFWVKIIQKNYYKFDLEGKYYPFRWNDCML